MRFGFFLLFLCFSVCSLNETQYQCKCEGLFVGRMTRVTHTRPVMTSPMVHVHVSMPFQPTDSSAKVSHWHILRQHQFSPFNCFNFFSFDFTAFYYCVWQTDYIHGFCLQITLYKCNGTDETREVRIHLQAFINKQSKITGRVKTPANGYGPGKTQE